MDGGTGEVMQKALIWKCGRVLW